jgi:hypothetical protein
VETDPVTLSIPGTGQVLECSTSRKDHKGYCSTKGIMKNLQEPQLVLAAYIIVCSERELVKTYSCTNLGIFLFVLVSKVVLDFNWVFKIRAHKMFFLVKLICCPR